MSDVQIGYRLQFFYIDKDGDPRTKDRGRWPPRIEDADRHWIKHHQFPPIDKEELRSRILAHVDEMLNDAKEFETVDE